ncbi:MAG: dienelactone hydrolase family protein [Candidatus Omnitrophica bacterium]|nr:dienelactone hydrolase family protein [Candidatus Omnitrophota bacterium]
MKYFFTVCFLFFFGMNAMANIHTETVEYKQGNTVLQGYLAYDDTLKDKAPAVLIVHEWTGIGPYVKKRAEQLASLGYVAFAIDIYGKGIRPKNKEGAEIQAAIYRSNRKLMREHAQAGLEQIKKYNFVDTKRIAAIGYCFGGGVSLELARSGADIAGVVSFHGNLDTPNPEDAKNIKTKILICHGADDKIVAWEQVAAFRKEMQDAHANWQMNIYSNAVHSFTNPDSGDNPSSGIAYNKEADMRSWGAMKLFFKEIFHEAKSTQE